MKQIWIIAKKETAAFFDSLIAYILLIIFLGFTGFFTWIYGTDIFFIKEATLVPFFNYARLTLFFFIPALTMKMVAEERRAGTIELLLTKPINDWQLILGKFLACLILVAIALALSLPFYFTTAYLGNVDHGAVFCGYLGMLLTSSAFISIGLFASCTTTNQIVAFLMALVINLMIMFIFPLLSSNLPGIMGEILSYLSVPTHFDSMARGVIDSKDILYFVSISFLGLVFSELFLSKRNLAD